MRLRSMGGRSLFEGWGGGLVEAYRRTTFATDEGDVALSAHGDRYYRPAGKELSDLGFIPLVHCKGTDYAAFFGTQSAQKAKKYDTDAANANARLINPVAYTSWRPRALHYLKVIYAGIGGQL